MLKKIVLVSALAVASFVSVNVASRAVSTTTAPATTVTMKYPPCDPGQGGWGCGNSAN